jgi:DNA-binding beta-propeller fold protein YncE
MRFIAVSTIVLVCVSGACAQQGDRVYTADQSSNTVSAIDPIEFTFRFNRRRSRFCGLPIYRLLQQAVALEPSPCKSLVGGISNPSQPQHIGATSPIGSM